MRPRIESWENVASHLWRFISPNLGKRLATEVTKRDIATLSNDIVAGKLGAPSMPTRATCAALPPACSTGRRKLAATM